MKKSMKPEESLLPFDVIEQAVQGDPAALAGVLRHFEGYIVKRSTRIFHDEFGHSYQGVDEELRQRIECKLVTRITMKFKIE